MLRPRGNLASANEMPLKIKMLVAEARRKRMCTLANADLERLWQAENGMQDNGHIRVDLLRSS